MNSNIHDSRFVVSPILPEHLAELERLQQIVFPTLAKEQLIRAEQYANHIRLFPEGQFVLLDGNRIVGMTSSMRSTFDYNNFYHTFDEIIAGGWMTNHNPEGDWLYGLDIGVHPDYRGMGLARLLYRARQEMARSLGLKGQITVGMMSGSGAVSHLMSGETYYRELLAGKRSDPTVSRQMKIGFRPIALIPDYLQDPVCGNYGVLIQLDIDTQV